MLALDPEQELINHFTEQASAERLVKEDLDVELLIRPQTKTIYRYVQAYYTKSGVFPTEEVLITEFPDEEFNKPASSVEWVLDTIRYRFKRAEINQLTYKISDLYNQDAIDEAMELLHDTATEIDRRTISNSNTWALDDIPMFITSLQDRVLNQNNFRSFTYGFKDIDNFTGGYRPGQLLFLAARPKRKKTFIHLHTFLEQIKEGKNPVYYTLELTHEEVMLRLLCMISGYSWNDAQRGNFSAMPHSWEYLQKSWEDFREAYNHSGHVVQPQERSVSALMLQAERLGADSVFISQLKYINSVKDYRNTYDKYTEIVHDLKMAATRPGKEIPIHLEAQFNREASKFSELAEADLAQLGLTDSIGQAADAIFAITEGDGERAMNCIEYGILESRNTDKASWWIEYDFKTGCAFKLKKTGEPFERVNRGTP